MPTDPPPTRASRGLLFPGPQPPLSHFGVTLQRHVVATGLRYALYHVGLPPPAQPPVRIVMLRLYLDAARLRQELDGVAGSEQIAAALLEPAGAGRLAASAPRPAAAAALHRARQRLTPGRRLAGGGGAPPSGSPQRLWETFRGRLSELLPPLGEALLAELLASLARRAGRARGRSLPACASPEAWRLLRGRRARLERLGPPDPLLPSWAESGVPEAAAASAHLARTAPPDRGRGRFRESYRLALDDLRRLYGALARSAVERGWLDRPDDAYFVPFDLAEDLAGERRPRWLRDAVAANRREHQGLLGGAAPPEILTGPTPDAGPAERQADLAPLWPLA